MMHGFLQFFPNSGGVLLSIVCSCLHGAVCHCRTEQIRDSRQLLNVADIKYRCLSNGDHSFRFLNRFGKFIQSPNRKSEMFSLLDAQWIN